MKPSFFLTAALAAGLLACLSLSTPVYGENETTALIGQARDLVHQAWNPDGDPPSDAQRTDLLNKAMALVKQTREWWGGYYYDQESPREVIIKDIQTALDELHNGDDADKVTTAIKRADIDMSRAMP